LVLINNLNSFKKKKKGDNFKLKVNLEIGNKTSLWLLNVMGQGGDEDGDVMG
jgi:hypothetical protein